MQWLLSKDYLVELRKAQIKLRNMTDGVLIPH